MVTHPAHMLAPGLAILFVVMALSFLGDSLQHAANPAMHHTRKKGVRPFAFNRRKKSVRT
ncbi:nickel ABC transporter permease subunit NikC, partial [Bacillus safensis]